MPAQGFVPLILLFSCLLSWVSPIRASAADTPPPSTDTSWNLVKTAQAAQNPFRAAEQNQEPEKRSPALRSFTSWYGKLIATISSLQKELRGAMSIKAHEIRTEPFGTPFWSFLLLAFCYGVVHALGPGHGKCFAVAYFTGHSARLRQALFLGGIMPAVHVAGAVVLVLGLLWILDAATFSAVQDNSLLLERISYAFLAVIGIVLFGKTVLELLSRSEEGESDECATKNSMLSIALAVGLVPCPAAAIILLFSISFDILFAGILATVFVALGMALTTTFISAATILSRSGLCATLSKRKKAAALAFRSLALAGSLLIAGVGMMLFFTTM